MKKEFTAVSIPTSLYKEIENAVQETKDGSVTNYVARVLRESLKKGGEPEAVFSAEDEEKVKDRLKALGYID